MTIQDDDRAAETRHKLIHGEALDNCDWCPVCGAEICEDEDDPPHWSCVWCEWYW